MALTNPTSAEHIAQEAGSFEPQRSNNFSIEIPLPAADRDLIIAAIHGLELPQQSNEVQEHEFQNERVKTAGQQTVEEMSLTLKDFVDMDVRGAILRWRKLVYDPLTGLIGLAADYKKTCNVILHAPNNTFVRVARLQGVWPSADPAISLTMEGGEKVLMEVPLQIDRINWSDSISGA